MFDSMVKKMAKVAMCVGFLAFAGAGCVGYHTPPMDRRVTVSPDLGAAVWVTDVRLDKIQSQQWTMQANVVNNTNGRIELEYCVVWMNANGMVVPTVMSTWRPIVAEPREVVSLQGTAPSPEAVDFRFYVQPKTVK